MNPMNPPTGIYNNLLPMKNTDSLINLRTVNMDVSIITITIYVQIVTTRSDKNAQKSVWRPGSLIALPQGTASRQGRDKGGEVK